MGDFKPIKIPPGVYRGASAAVAPGKWFDANMVRWVGDSLRPVLGWDKLVLSAAFASVVRATHKWTDNLGGVWIGVLCENNIYVVDSGGTVVEITPVGFVGPAADVFAGGYGDYQYSYGAYGDPRPASDHLSQIGPTWKLSNWGQNLLICSSYDGRLLQWTPNVVGGSLAAVVANAPVPIRTFVVTPERYVMVFGGASAANFNQFAWCDQEDITNWDFASVTTTAGFFTVQPAAPILSAIETKWGILMFTSTSVFLVQYTGLPYVYTMSAKISDGATPLSDSSLVNYKGYAFWMADDGFWTFNGSTVVPQACSVLDWVRDTINKERARYRCVSVNLLCVPEIWFFFPSADSSENDKYVIWNYADGWWSMGKLFRTAGCGSGYDGFPTMSNGADLFYHEHPGAFYGDYVELPYASTSFINTNSGAVLTAINQAVVDHSAPAENVYYTFEGRIATRMNQNVPPDVQSDPPGKLTCRSDGYLDFRINARDIIMTIGSADNGCRDWSFGQILLKTSGRGSR